MIEQKHWVFKLLGYIGILGCLWSAWWLYHHYKASKRCRQSSPSFYYCKENLRKMQRVFIMEVDARKNVSDVIFAQALEQSAVPGYRHEDLDRMRECRNKWNDVHVPRIVAISFLLFLSLIVLGFYEIKKVGRLVIFFVILILSVVIWGQAAFPSRINNVFSEYPFQIINGDLIARCKVPHSDRVRCILEKDEIRELSRFRETSLEETPAN